MRSRTIVLLLLTLALLAVAVGFATVHWSKGGEGAGLYSRYWSPDPVQGYWDPDNFYQSSEVVEGVFEGEQCVACHQGVTPGIVTDWQASRHANSDKTVYCNDCHGSDHQLLRMPTPAVCANCHQQQHNEFLDEARYGFPSHVLAMERAVDAPHFADKPKAEVQSCVQCHSVATKCDSCHSRHRFSAAEARRPEACITCHSGPPHPDDETYFNSAHGKLYLQEGKTWDWSKPLTKGNYQAPTCAYCHMDGGKHQVAHKSLWKFGLREVNPHTSGNRVIRQRWIKLCSDCHKKEDAAQWLSKLDEERKQAWSKLYQAESLLKELRSDELIEPAVDQRPEYPLGSLLPKQRIGFFEGQASAFYNVSGIERSYFEMWYFDNLRAYKSAAHGYGAGVIEGHKRLDESLQQLQQKAEQLHNQEDKLKPVEWNHGAYTDYNRENN